VATDNIQSCVSGNGQKNITIVLDSCVGLARLEHQAGGSANLEISWIKGQQEGTWWILDKDLSYTVRYRSS